MESSMSSQASATASDTAGAIKSAYRDFKHAARPTPEDLRSELSDVRSELHDLLSHASDMSEDELAAAHAKMTRHMRSLRSTSRRFARQESFHRGMDTTSEYVKDHPLQTMLVAAGAGALFGLLVSRHR